MKNKQYRSLGNLLLILILCYTPFSATTQRKALIVVPVADLVCQPLKSLHPNKNIAQIYKELPLAHAGKITPLSCPRVHQLLFNEVVNVIKETDNEVLISIQNVYYKKSSSTKHHTNYWTLKQNIMTFNNLTRHNVDVNMIPQPIDFQSNNVASYNRNTIALTSPFFDPITKQTFSAGTRFVQAKKQPYKNKKVVFVFNPTMQKMRRTTIPKKICLAQTFKTRHEQIQKYLQILKQWAHRPDGIIPYVWGGCSFTTACSKTAFTQKTQKIDNQIASFFVRTQDTQATKNGFDCTGIITRAAQLCGIPYFFKNTYTLAHTLKSLDHKKALQEGDLIWIPGHVMVVANLQKNTLIEARTYDHGYGKVHEIELNKVFKDIRTYNDLKKAFFNKKKLSRIDKNGNIADRFPHFKLLSLANVWQ